MSSVSATILEHGIIAVIDSPVEEELLNWAIAAAKGGIKLLGVPVTLESVMDTVSDLSDDADLVVGISGVMKAEQVSIAVAAGAELVITPVADPEVIGAAKSRGLTVISGAWTPTEVGASLQAGADFVSLHPLGTHPGGKAYYEVIARMYPETRFLVSGQVGVQNAPDYLELGAAAAIVDRGVFPEANEPSALEIITARAVALVEVCTDALGMPKRASMTDALKPAESAASDLPTEEISDLLVHESEPPEVDIESFDLEILE